MVNFRQVAGRASKGTLSSLSSLLLLFPVHLSSRAQGLLPLLVLWNHDFTLLCFPFLPHLQPVPHALFTGTPADRRGQPPPLSLSETCHDQASSDLTVCWIAEH